MLYVVVLYCNCCSPNNKMLIRRLLNIKSLRKINQTFIGCQSCQKFQRMYYSSDQKGDIIISKVKKDDYKTVSNFLIKNFYPYEPMGVALGLNIEKEVTNWLPKYVKAHLALSPPVSSQAIDTKNGKVVGISFAVVIDPRVPRPPLMVDFVNPETQPIKKKICVFLDEIEEGLNAPELLGIKSLSSDSDSKILDNLMLSIDKEYRGRGLAVELIKKTEGSAIKVKDCLAAKVVVTSEFSYKAYLKREFMVIREFQYKKYKTPEGIQIFQGKESQLGAHYASRVMIKQLV